MVGRAATQRLSAADPTVGDVEELLPPETQQPRIWALRLAAFLVLMAVWELLGRQASPLMMSYPTAILAAAREIIANGDLGQAALSSLYTLGLGFGASAVVGVALGMLIGRYKAVEASLDWLVNGLYALPRVAIVPLVIMWFGLGLGAKVFLVFTVAVFPILINTSAGVRNVPPYLLDVARAFVASERQIFLKIILPSALPYMMTGLRLGVGRAIIGLVVAEFFTAVSGLGALIVKYGNQYDTAKMFVPLLILMIIGVSLSASLTWLEQRVAPWRETEH